MNHAELLRLRRIVRQAGRNADRFARCFAVASPAAATGYKLAADYWAGVQSAARVQLEEVTK